MSARLSPCTIRSRRRVGRNPRRGVLLLIVMALLALLTLLGLTLVVATSQGRMSAIAAAKANSEATRDDSEISRVLNQVLVGTNDSNSVLQGHGLIEDLYGPPQLFGRVLPTSAASPPVVQLAGGQLLNMNVEATAGYVLAPYNGAYCGQVITMIDGPAQGYSSRVVGYTYNGGTPASATLQVLSFDGLVPNPAIGTNLGDQFLINGRPFSGTGFGFNLTNVAPASLNTKTPVPTVFAGPYTGVTPTGPLLNAVEVDPTPQNTNKPPASNMPYAFLPNHSQIQLTPLLPASNPVPQPPYYYDPSGPGGANESYDAVDFQNMLLAMHIHQFDAVLNKVTQITPIPSLHRPELVAWCAQQALATGNPNINMSGAGYPNNLMRRKVVMRPEPMDQAYIPATHDKFPGIAGQWDFREPFVDLNGDQMYTPSNMPPEPFLDLNGDGTWTTGDLDYSGNQFNPITGCWYLDGSVTPALWRVDPNVVGGLDIDNDNDGIRDSIWVDVGLPVQTMPDGTQYKWLAAILCIDMDGKINLNAHGTIAQLDPSRYFNTAGTLTVPGPLGGTTSGQTQAESAAGVRNLVFGQGYGPPEVNPAYVFSKLTGVGTGSYLLPQVNANTLNYYTYLMMGYAYYDYSNVPPNTYPTYVYSVDGKYGESARGYTTSSAYWGLYPPSNGNSPYPGMGTLFRQYLLGGPRPGWSRWVDPWMTNLTYSNSVFNPTLTPFDWVNDPLSMARLSDYRPFLLRPQSQLQSLFNTPAFAQQGVFFDFLGPNMQPNLGSTVSAPAYPGVHLPTAHGSPYDLLARGVVVTDLRGAPAYAGTSELPWMMGASATGATDPGLPLASTVPAIPPPPYPWDNDSLYDAKLNPLNDAVDSAYELDLSPDAPNFGRITGDFGGTGVTTKDSPFAPSEFEGVLRSNDSDAADLRKRLDQLETVFTNAASPQRTLPDPLDPSSLKDVRLSLTSESWDLPVASVALTPQQMQDVAQFNQIMFNAGGPQLNLSGLSLTDLARARIFAENFGNPVYTTAGAADSALFGTVNSNPAAAASGFGIWPLLAPEVIMGMRLDINRLLGNGQDDNGNGVVDEPTEVLRTDAMGNLLTEWLTYPWSPNTSLTIPSGVLNTLTNLNTGNPIKMNNTAQWLDLNNDGLLPMVGANVPLVGDPQATTPLAALGDTSLADTRARQLLARHLYVTMMLLLDDRSITANIYQPSGAMAPWNTLAANSREQAAYLVAQWAINVVDFRDRDSIMTPFEFDVYPFVANDPTNQLATWNVDDVVGTADDANPWRGIVWGCERPELLLTEAVAFHDRGTDDTNQAQDVSAGNPDTLLGQGTNPDMDYDQVRRPRGSLIIELFNPTSWTNAPQRDLQYDQNLALQPWQTGAYAQPWMNANYGTAVTNQGFGVNLAQVAHQPVGSTTLPLSSPVWRLAIAYSPQGYDTHLNAGATAYTLDPRAPQVPTTRISRAVYFTPYQPTFVANGTVNNISGSQSFFADPDVIPLNTFLMVPPGQYAVVGPASPVTAGNLPATSTASFFSNSIFIGQNYSTSAATGRVSPAANAYSKQLELGGGGGIGGWNGPVGMYSGTTAQSPYSNSYALTDIKPVVGVPIQTNWLDSSGNYIQHLSTNTTSPPSTTLRMSISEPLTGYPIFNGVVADDDFYYSGQGTPKSGQFPTHPFDSGLSTNPSVPSTPNPRVGDGTTTGYTIIFLQRLANPLVPWNEFTNPYITVDSMPVDLTGYTGENHPLDPMSTASTEPAYANAPMAGLGATALDTRRRGEQRVTGMNNPEAPNVWAPVQWPPNALTTGTTAAPLPSHTLGYINAEYSGGSYYSATNPGNLATISTSTGIPASQFYGDPQTPFPWLTWLDRPYVSQYELMLVPASSPASLCSDFGMLGWQGNYTPGNSVTQYLPGQPASAGQLPVAQFEHLLNFYSSEQAPNPTPPPPATPPPPGTYMPNLYRVFEHVHVPSRFAGTQTMLTPYPFEPLPGSLPHLFHPPFNWASSYREPGKINLNTVFEPQVFQGLMDGYPGWGTLWSQVVDSRQGFNGILNPVVPNWSALWNPDGAGRPQNTVYPTFFANPFRPDGAGALVPQASMTTSVTPPTSPYSMMHAWNYPNGTPPNNSYNGVNATMLRARSIYANPGQALNPAITSSLFDDGTFDPFNVNTAPANVPYNPTTTPPANFQLTTNDGGSSIQYRNAARNPYFQYQALQRLGNLATNRSNVYSVWITLGKFQVQRVPISRFNPDGYMLVNEVGSSTGEIERKRAFFMIDRSIPVGFSRGQNLNVERTVLVERILDD
jgi:hypothetical protein